MPIPDLLHAKSMHRAKWASTGGGAGCSTPAIYPRRDFRCLDHHRRAVGIADVDSDLCPREGDQRQSARMADVEPQRRAWHERLAVRPVAELHFGGTAAERAPEDLAQRPARGAPERAERIGGEALEPFLLARR